MNNDPHKQLAYTLSARYQAFPEVQAIGLGGSQAGGLTDAGSDIDLYIFSARPLALQQRQAVVQARGAARADLDLTYWDAGDEWIDLPSGIEVDVMYWEPAWSRAQVDRALVEHQAWLGYTTSHWHTVKHMQPLYDPSGWLQALVAHAAQPYPEPLRGNIIHKNHPVLRQVIPSYYNQVEKAVRRGDLVSINHRVAALLASYFDILFAFNRQTNPGEKKLVQLAQQTCPLLPAGMAEDVAAVLHAAGASERTLLPALTRLLDNLDTLLVNEGIIPAIEGQSP